MHFARKTKQVLMELPIVEVIVDNPESEEAVYELHRLILLMLGCAVRGKNGQQHVDLIKSFDEKMQHDVKDALAASMNDEVPTATAEDIEFMSKDELADALRRVSCNSALFLDVSPYVYMHPQPQWTHTHTHTHTHTYTD